MEECQEKHGLHWLLHSQSPHWSTVTESHCFSILEEAKRHFEPDICSSKNHLSSLSYEGWACTFALAEEDNRNIRALPSQTRQNTWWQLGLVSGGKGDLSAYCISQERIPKPWSLTQSQEDSWGLTRVVQNKAHRKEKHALWNKFTCGEGVI